MDLAPLHTKMAEFIKDTGKTTSNLALEMFCFQTP